MGQTRPALRLAWVPALAVIYFITAKLGLRLAIVHPSATAVWPPTGISIAAVLLLGPGVWPGVFLGAFLANVTTAGTTVAAAFGIANGNTLEAIVGGWLVTRFAGGRDALDSSRGAFLFALLAGGLATVVSATIGVATQTVAGTAPFSRFGAIWLTWWLGDCAGALVVAPVIMLWSARPRMSWDWRRRTEAAILGVVLCGASLAIFTDQFHAHVLYPSLAFLCLPPLLWCSFRFDTRTTATAMVVLSTIAVWGTVQGSGPFIEDDPNASLLLLQSFTCVVSVTLLALSGALEERGRSASALDFELTERKRLEEQLLHAQKMESIALLAGGVAHDFNNLLNSILGYADFALASLPGDAPARQDVGEIRRAAERGATITRQLLAFGRRQVLAPRIVDLAGVVHGMEELFHRLLGGGIEVVTRLAPVGTTVRADRAQVEVVLMNLVINARDAMPNGGTLTIEVSRRPIEEEDILPASGLHPGPYVELAVSDTGCGMSEEVLSRLFEPFFTTKERGRGTGLGLASVHGIVKQSGGQVRATSRVGKGSRFEVHLPYVDAPAETPALAIHPDARPRSCGTILVVEDEPSLLRLTSRILSSAGYDVSEASDAQMAIESFERRGGDLDLLLTDVVLPGMSGPQLAEKLRSERPGLPVLFVSGYTFEQLAPHGIAAGMPFLQKPFVAEALLERVHELVPRRG